MRRFLSILFLLLSWGAGAMEGRFVNYGSAHGLPSNSVYAITQDADGFLWVGTRGGLCRFDGARFQLWKETGRVNALAVDRENRLWVGTTDGLYVRGPETKEVGRTAAGQDGSMSSGPGEFHKGPAGNIRALLADSDGFVWATVGDSVLVKMHFVPGEGVREDARTWYKKRYNEGDYPYFQIFEAGDGRLWLGGRIVNSQYVARRDSPVVAFPREGGSNNSGSYAQADGALYSFDDYFNTLCVYDGECFRARGRLPVAHARLLADSRGRLWAAGSYGLALVNTVRPEASTIFRHAADDPFSLASGELYCIFEDRQGNLWVGGDNGLSVLCPALQLVRTLSRRQVSALLQTRDGKMWVGTAEDRVSCLYEDRSGTVYVGLWNNTGFQIWKDGVMRKGIVTGPIPREQEPVAGGDRRTSNWISDFLEDSRGRFWVVTWEGVGLNEWDRETGKTLPPGWLSPFWYPSPQVDSNIFLSSRLGSRLIEDAQGNLVFATTEAGLNIIDKDSGLVTKYYRGNSSIPDDYVTDLCLTPDGTLWAATRGGLWSPSGGHCLDGTLVQSVRADDAGRLWAGTEEGLYFRDTDGSTGVARKGLGFPSDIYGEKVSCRLSDGSLAFGGSAGAVAFHPDSLLALAGTAGEGGLAGDDRSEAGVTTAPGVMGTGGLMLTAFSTSDAGFQFAFSVKNLPLASLAQYRYRLSGVDKDWVQAEYPRLQGRYNSLSPGRHTLEIQCTDVFGRWQEPPLAYTFRIRPPLLLSWPFLLLYLLLLALAVWLIVRYRENRQRALVLQEELDTRNRFFGIVSHDLRNPVSGMKTLLSALKDAPEDKLREGLKAVDAAAQHTSALLENLLMWSVSQQGVLRPALRDVPLASIVAEAVGNRDIPAEIPEGLVVHTDPHMLATCLRNLLDNAVRYSPSWVRLQADGKHIVITDHGPGMDPETLRTLSRPGHLGLTITRELLEKMGASLSACNLPEGGCEVTIHLP